MIRSTFKCVQWVQEWAQNTPVLSEWKWRSSEGPTLLNMAGFLKSPVSKGRCYNRDLVCWGWLYLMHSSNPQTTLCVWGGVWQTKSTRILMPRLSQMVKQYDKPDMRIFTICLALRHSIGSLRVALIRWHNLWWNKNHVQASCEINSSYFQGYRTTGYVTYLHSTQRGLTGEIFPSTVAQAQGFIILSLARLQQCHPVEDRDRGNISEKGSVH